MYDAVLVRRVSSAADENAASNALVSNSHYVLCHKVVLDTPGSAALRVEIHDDINSSAASRIKIALQTPDDATVSQTHSLDFNPPVPFTLGVSFNFTGDNAGACYFYYTRV